MGAPLHPSVDAAVAALRKRGLLQREIARDLGIGKTSVERILKRLGLVGTLANRQASRNTEIILMQRRGVSVAEIGARFGLHVSSVYSVLAKGRSSSPREKLMLQNRARCVELFGMPLRRISYLVFGHASHTTAVRRHLNLAGISAEMIKAKQADWAARRLELHQQAMIQAREMKLSGMTYPMIGRALGYSASGAHHLAQRAWKAATAACIGLFILAGQGWAHGPAAPAGSELAHEKNALGWDCCNGSEVVLAEPCKLDGKLAIRVEGFCLAISPAAIIPDSSPDEHMRAWVMGHNNGVPAIRCIMLPGSS
jgi:transposase